MCLPKCAGPGKCIGRAVPKETLPNVYGCQWINIAPHTWLYTTIKNGFIIGCGHQNATESRPRISQNKHLQASHHIGDAAEPLFQKLKPKSHPEQSAVRKLKQAASNPEHLPLILPQHQLLALLTAYKIHLDSLAQGACRDTQRKPWITRQEDYPPVQEKVEVQFQPQKQLRLLETTISTEAYHTLLRNSCSIHSIKSILRDVVSIPLQQDSGHRLGKHPQAILHGWARYTEPFLKPIWPWFSPRKPDELGQGGLKQMKQITHLSVPADSQQCFWTQLPKKDDTPKQVWINYAWDCCI